MYNFLKGLHSAGKFVIKQSGPLPVLKIEKSIHWPNGKPPLDTPECGFKGEYCLKNYSTREIVMGVAGGVAMVMSVVIILAYRNYKYEQELDSLLWKIDPSELHVKNFVTEDIF